MLSVFTVAPVASPETNVTPVVINVSLASASVAPARRSMVNIELASVLEPVTTPETVGTSFVPEIVIVMASVVPSAVLTVTVSEALSPAPSD